MPSGDSYIYAYNRTLSDLYLAVGLQVTLSAGTRLGPYEILAPLGAGGMGEVYRAKDPRLGREVAIKVLPASFSQDPDRLKRFEQEARAAGVLNHPNITAVHDFGTHDDAPYIVTELLEGETLRARLLSGSLPRAQGHRLRHPDREGPRGGAREGDRPPGPEAREPVPDEGRAGQDPRLRPREAEDRGRRERPDGLRNGLGRHAARRRARDDGLHGARAGAREGRPTARSDLFSFGTILYEMLSGQRAFRGDTAADTITAILTKEPPDLSQTNKEVHPGARPDRAPLPREEPGGAVRVGARRRVRPGVALERLDADGCGLGARARRSDRAGSDRPCSPRRSPRRRPRGRVPRSARRPASFRLPNYQQLTFRRGELYTARFAPDGQTVIYCGGLGRQARRGLRDAHRTVPSRACSASWAPTWPRSRRPARCSSSSTGTSTEASSASGRSPRSACPEASLRARSRPTSSGPIGGRTERASPSFATCTSASSSSFPPARCSTRPPAGSAIRASRRRAISSPSSTIRSGATTAARSSSSTAPARRRTLAGVFASDPGPGVVAGRRRRSGSPARASAATARSTR